MCLSKELRKVSNAIGKGSFAEYFFQIKNSSTGEVLHLENSRISNCDLAFYGYETPSDFTVSLVNDTIINNDYGFIYGQNLTVTNCIFSDGEKGIHGWEGPNITIKNSEFSNFSIWPLNLEGLIDSCHIHHNAVGIRMKPSLEVRNCLIEFNDVGVAAEYVNQVPGENIHNNRICNSTLYNFKHLYSYPVNIPNNCWCLDDEEDIALTIYDAYDDVSLGIVTFTPFLTCDSVTNVNNVTGISQDYIFPNPAGNYIQIYPESEIQYEIYSISGILISNGRYYKGIDVSSLSKGFYLIKTLDTLNEVKVRYFKLLKD